MRDSLITNLYDFSSTFWQYNSLANSGRRMQYGLKKKKKKKKKEISFLNIQTYSENDQFNIYAFWLFR